MKKTLKKLIASLVVFAMLFAFAGCKDNSSTQKSSTEKQGTQPITLGIMDWAGVYPWFGIRDTGILEKNNANVDVKYFQKYSDLIAAFTAGNIDMVGLSYGDTIPAMQSGLSYKFVDVTDCTYGADALVVNPEINSVADLKGKKIATELGTSDHYYLYKILEENNMSIDDIQFVNLGLTEANAAMTSGQVDAVVTLEPFLGQLIAQGKKKLVDSSQMYGIVPCALLAKDDILTNRKDEIVNILSSWYDGIDKIRNRDEEFIKACAKGAGITVDDINSYLDIIKFLTPEEGLEAFKNKDEYINIVYNTQQWSEFFLKENLIKKVPENIDQYLDDSFLKEYIETKK